MSQESGPRVGLQWLWPCSLQRKSNKRGCTEDQSHLPRHRDTVQCALCKSVAHAIKKKPRYPGKHVWKYRDVQQNAGCATCQKIARRLEIHTRADNVGEWTGSVSHSWPEDHCTLIIDDRRVRDRFNFPDYFVMNIYDIPDAPSFLLFDQQINIEGIKRWIDKCEKEHTGRCHTITNPGTEMPDTKDLRFIDVEKLCLTKQSDHEDDFRYAALSYVWGTAVDPFQTVKANVEALSQGNAFDLPCNRNRLPNTIADSILFTRALGLRYLWVDRFCIVQDDEVAKPYQLASMASIYSNAYVTIAATEGKDSAYGIPGVSKERPRNPPSEVYHFSPSCRVHVSVPTYRVRSVLYHTRGWTFQEWTFSRRIIVFHDQSVSWICQKLIQSENAQIRPITHGTLRRGTWDTYPNFHGYCNAVEVYSRRDLTYSEDILAAFNAFMTVQGRAMKSSFTFGIPEIFLPSMLYWRHDIVYFQKRRTDRQGKVLEAFPSWSWAGWSGPIDMWSARRACTLAIRRRHCYTLDYPHPLNIYKVVIDSHGERKEHVKDLHYYETLGLVSLEDKGYLSSRLPVKLFDKKPLIRDDDDTGSFTAECGLSTILEFRTRRLIASLSRHDREDLRKGTPVLTGPEDEVIGILDIDISLDAPELVQHEVELICIGVGEPMCTEHAQLRDFRQGKVFQERCPYTCFLDYDHFALQVYEPASKWQFMSYHVLWIEWEDGIAYRKAIGHVWKDEWDAADTEEVDIRLG